MSRHTVLAALMMVSLVAAVAPCGDTRSEEKQPFAERLARADALLKEKAFREAAALYTQLLKDLPIQSTVCQKVLQGFRKSCDGSWQGATFVAGIQEALTRLEGVETNEDVRRELRLQFLKILASYYDDHRQVLGAIEAYEKIVAVCAPEERSAVKNKLARAYDEGGYGEKALAIYREKVEKDTKNRNARKQLARSYFKLGRVEEGTGVWGPDATPSETRQMARQLLQARCLAAAEKLALSALEDDPRAETLLAEIYCEQKRFDEAEGLFLRGFEKEKPAEERDGKRFDLAEKIAAVHVNRGTAEDAVAKIEAAMKTLANDQKGKRRIFLIRLIELMKQNGDSAGALEAFLEYRELVENNGARRDWMLARLGPPAFRQYISEGRSEHARALVIRIRELRVGTTWLDAVEYILLIHEKKSQEAQAFLTKLEVGAADNETKLFQLADELSSWKRELVVPLYKRLLEIKPDRTIYDMNAHARLAQHYARLKDYAGAKVHFDALNEGLSARNVGIVGEESMRELEAYVQYKAADADPETLLGLLFDPHPLRRLAGARLLGRYGREEDIPAMEKAAANAAPKHRAALKEAVTTIQSRGASHQELSEKVTEENLKKVAGGRGKVLRVQRDSVEKELCWVFIEKQFVLCADLEKGTLVDFEESLALLSDASLTASSIVCQDAAVWVGTDRGLFAFDRRSRTWSGYAVNREHIDVLVKALEMKDGDILVTIAVGDGDKTFRFDPADGAWEPGSSENF